MSTIFFRAQDGHHSFSEMCEHADDIDYNVSTFGSDIAAGRRGILD